MQIKNIPLEQLDTIQTLWEALNAMHQQYDRECNMNIRSTTWADRKRELLAKKPQNLDVVYDGEIPVGYCFSSIDEYAVGEIDSLYIVPPCRGAGFGKKLLNRALEWLDEQRCNSISVWVHPGNKDGVKFYWQFGFITEPTMKKLR